MADTNKNPKILLISKAAFFDIDKLGSTVVLGKLLSEKYSTDVDIHFQMTPPMQDLTRIVSPRNVNFIEKLDADYFTISIDRGNAKVTEVKWEETSDKIKLLIFTEKGDVDTNQYAMTPGQPHYDQLYTLGIKTEEDTLNILGDFKGLWTAAETYNLDIRNENTKYGQTNLIHPDAKSYAELIVHIAEELELEIKADEATELLAFIYWKTNSLRNKYTTSLSLNHVNKLMSKGGDLTEATYKIFSSLSLIEAKARQEIHNNLVINSDKIAISRIGKDTAQQLLKAHPIMPEKNPLYHLRDAHASFVIIPMQAGHTLVLASGQEDKVNIKKLFGQFNFVGDALQAELTFNIGADEAEKEIMRILDQKVFKRQADNKPSQSQPVKPVEKKPEPKQSQRVEQKSQQKPQPKQEIRKEQPRFEKAEPAKPQVVQAKSQPVIARPTKIAETKLPREMVEATPILPVAEVKQPEPIKVNPVTQPTDAAELKQADPLSPASEQIQPQPAPLDLNLAPVTPGGAGFGDFGPIGGFGGNGAATNSDPLPSAA